MITYLNASSHVLKKFPELACSPFYPESPTLLFAELADVLAEQITKSNNDFVFRAVKFINDIAENNDTDVQGLLSEFAITLYDLHKNEYAHFVSRLSQEASRTFDHNIELWRNNQSDISSA